MNFPIKLDLETFKIIITELKQSRKEVMMIIIFICLLCGLTDYFLRRHGIILNLFTTTYLILGFITFGGLLLKIYIDLSKYIEHRQILKKNYKLLKPILETLSSDEEYLLRKFVRDDCTKIVLFEEDLKAIDFNYDAINTIFKKFEHFDYYLIQCAHDPNLILRTQKPFFEILKIHFKRS